MKFTYLKQLRVDLQHLERHQPLFTLLKKELQRLGYWRNRPRGNPKKGYQAMKRREETNASS